MCLITNKANEWNSMSFRCAIGFISLNNIVLFEKWLLFKFCKKLPCVLFVCGHFKIKMIMVKKRRKYNTKFQSIVSYIRICIIFNMFYIEMWQFEMKIQIAICIYAQNSPPITKCPDISYNIELDFYDVYCNFRSFI